MSIWDEIEDRLRNPVVAGLAFATLGTAAFYGVRRIFGGMAGLPEGVIPPRPSAVPFAQIRGRLVWPIATNDSRRGEVAYTDIHGDVHGNWARRFAAPRDGRKHAGIDLYGRNGDPVLAIADGTVVEVQSFHLGSDAILVEHDGAVVLYGEVESGSWDDFGIDIGSRVKAGDPIARIDCMVGSGASCSSHMLHFETYVPGTRGNEQWYGSPPPELLDPTLLLLTAAPAGANR